MLPCYRQEWRDSRLASLHEVLSHVLPLRSPELAARGPRSLIPDVVVNTVGQSSAYFHSMHIRCLFYISHFSSEWKPFYMDIFKRFELLK